MSCANLYFGNSLAEAPPSPFWQNPAIETAGAYFKATVFTTIPVTIKNGGSTLSPKTLVELFYADPSTAFTPLGQIPPLGQVVEVPGFIEGADEADQPWWPVNFGWSPPPLVTLPNGGHVRLLARASMLAAPSSAKCQQQVYGPNPATDRLHALRSVHVHAPPFQPGGGGAQFMQFGFGAASNLLVPDKTRLSVCALTPQLNPAELSALAADPVVDQILTQRNLSFGTPAALRLGWGRERIINNYFGQLPTGFSVPRLSRTGPVSLPQLANLLAPQQQMFDVGGPQDLMLNPRETLQTFVQIKTSGKKKVAYAVQIEHKGSEGTPIGGLTVLFVPPYSAL